MCALKILFVVAGMVLMISSSRLVAGSRVNAKKKNREIRRKIDVQTNACYSEFSSKTCGDYGKARACYERAEKFARNFSKDIGAGAELAKSLIFNTMEKEECPENVLPNATCYKEYIKRISDESHNGFFTKDSEELCRLVNNTLNSLETLKEDCPQRKDYIPKEISLFQEYQSVFCYQGTLRPCINRDFKKCFKFVRRGKFKCRNPEYFKFFESYVEKVPFAMRKCFIQDKQCEDSKTNGKKLKFTNRAHRRLC